MKYSAEDFENAKFAEHPEGRLAVRNCLHPVLPWECNDTYHNDGYMSANGWSPVPLKLTIVTESELEAAIWDEYGDYRGDWNVANSLGITVVPDPEPKLPTEPGAVIRVDGRTWVLGRDQTWRSGHSYAFSTSYFNGKDCEVVA